MKTKKMLWLFISLFLLVIPAIQISAADDEVEIVLMEISGFIPGDNPLDDSEQNTTIGYYLPTDTREASIHIYDMNGTEIVVFSIDTFGQGELTINAGTLRAGMYLYSLIADGQLVDTKQMILTK